MPTSPVPEGSVNADRDRKARARGPDPGDLAPWQAAKAHAVPLENRRSGFATSPQFPLRRSACDPNQGEPGNSFFRKLLSMNPDSSQAVHRHQAIAAWRCKAGRRHAAHDGRSDARQSVWDRERRLWLEAVRRQAAAGNFRAVADRVPRAIVCTAAPLRATAFGALVAGWTAEIVPARKIDAIDYSTMTYDDNLRRKFSWTSTCGQKNTPLKEDCAGYVGQLLPQLPCLRMAAAQLAPRHRPTATAFAVARLAHVPSPDRCMPAFSLRGRNRASVGVAKSRIRESCGNCLSSCPTYLRAAGPTLHACVFSLRGQMLAMGPISPNRGPALWQVNSYTKRSRKVVDVVARLVYNDVCAGVFSWSRARYRGRRAFHGCHSFQGLPASGSGKPVAITLVNG
jgi:hypothetical protein